MDIRNKTFLMLLCLGIIGCIFIKGVLVSIPNDNNIDKTEEAVTQDFKNVWIISGHDNEISFFTDGENKKYTTKYDLSETISDKIGDITVVNNIVTGIILKPDIIEGKVLSIGDNFIEVQGYGKVKISDDFTTYKIYNGISSKSKNNIIVGYDNVKFVVSGEIICSALITKEIEPSNIRVLINSTNYENIYHDKVLITSNDDFIIIYNGKSIKYNANEEIKITKESKMFKNNRILIRPQNNNSKLQINSIKRQYGNPKYRGELELRLEKDGIIIVNELPIEQYLYSVIPSEMPVSYGKEALKVQAVCARSYVYNQLYGNNYSKYGANVDDSVSCQVYNNVEETKDATLAVKETKGEVLTLNGKVLTAYYFSTSCGRTSSTYEVWKKEDTVIEEPEIKGNLQTKDKQQLDLSDESIFRKFIDEDKYDTYDSDFAFYRWNVTIPASDLKKSIEKALNQLYNKDCNKIEVLKKGSYKLEPIKTIGKVKDIQIIKRETSGLVSQILIIGSKATIRVTTEYYIRLLLAPLTNTINLNDNTIKKGFSILPSAYFYMQFKNDKYKFIGGGYGHGVGMSQNGVKTMINEGNTYKQILQYYYDGSKIENIYK